MPLSWEIMFVEWRSQGHNAKFGPSLLILLSPLLFSPHPATLASLTVDYSGTMIAPQNYRRHQALMHQGE